jgi:hypothetical protein
MVKPQFFTHYELYEAEQQSGLPLRLAYEGLWCVADREGRFEWKPPVLKLDILPYDTLDFGSILTALEKAGFVRGYTVDGRKYGVIPTFSRHQNPHVHERASVIPPPPEPNGNGNHASTVQAPYTHSAEHYTRPSESESESVYREEVQEHVELAPEKHGANSTAVVLRSDVEPVAKKNAVHAVLTEVGHASRRRTDADRERAAQAEFVFAYWALVMQHPRALFDDKRRSRIEGALRQNKGDVGELLYAIDGARRTPHLMGDNEQQQKYDGIETVLRDRGQIEKLAAKIPAYQRGEQHPRVLELTEVA